jgi:hypothetical protein
MKKLILALTVIGTAFLAAPVLAQVAIDPVVAEELSFMREEEKLAHDVYVLFDGLYGSGAPGSNIFARIADSETRHTEAVLKLLVTYNLPDPAQPEEGVFLNPDLQSLYDTLVAIGKQGKLEALGVGVLIEQKDMTDIVEAIELSVAYPDIVQAYSNLLSGSESHLAAFLQALEKPAGSGGGAF